MGEESGSASPNLSYSPGPPRECWGAFGWLSGFPGLNGHKLHSIFKKFPFSSDRPSNNMVSSQGCIRSFDELVVHSISPRQTWNSLIYLK